MQIITERRHPYKRGLITAAVFASAFFLMLYYSKLFNMLVFRPDFECVFMSAYFALALFALIFFSGLCIPRLSYPDLVCIGFFCLAALTLRINFLNYISPDYVSFLSEWSAFFRDNGGFSALRYPLGDYNVSYLYYMAAYSYVPVYDLYMIKIFSISFDILAALFAVKVVSLYTSSDKKKMLALGAVLFFPTVWLNSAYWGQCDSIYTAFMLMCVYFGLKGRPVLCVAASALAFAFKLQTVFLLPILLIFIFIKKLKFRQLLVFPAVYIILVLPAVLLGKSFAETLTIYLNQTSTYDGLLNLNSPSAFAIVSGEPFDVFKLGAVAVTAAALSALLIYLWVRRGAIAKRQIITCCLLLCSLLPFLLPSMHERYFFMMDIFAVIYACIYAKRWYIPILSLVASYAGYHAFLMGQYIIDLRFAALAVLAIIIMGIYDLHKSLEVKPPAAPAITL